MRWIAIPGVLFLVACSAGVAEDHPPPATSLPQPPPWHDLARRVARTYALWGRVDDRLRFAPADCLLIRPSAHMSQSRDAATHGRKLYSLFARDPVAYGAPATSPLVPREQPPADATYVQAIVKEAYRPIDCEGAHSPLLPAEVDGHSYCAGETFGLFMMIQPAGEPAGTDHGWIYATQNAAGEITAAGQIRTCVNCHADAGEDRLFGTPDR